MLIEPVAVVLLQTLACLGLGAATLRLARVGADLTPAERVGWAFALGVGVLGWLLFWIGLAGLFDPVWLAGLLVVGAAGSVLLPKVRLPWPATRPRPSAVGGLLLVAAALTVGLTLCAGLVPPADADSLAYHFAIPRDWVRAGRLVFIPRAADGAVPLLIQTTYVPMLALGGERALTLWAVVTSGAGAGLTYAVGRRWLAPVWAGTVALAFLTLPAMVAAGSTGQVEPRLALFTLVAILALASARRTGLVGAAAIAGLAAGFYVGSKYLGLVFAGAVGLAALAGRGGLRRSAVVGLATTAAGFQWYLWNWLKAGDPLFPMLYRWLGSPIWTPEIDERFRSIYLSVEAPLPRTLAEFLAYPVKATLGGMDIIEATRTGLGPLLLLLVPFAAAGVWTMIRRRSGPPLVGHPLMTAAAVMLIFYTVWFFFGPSQRVRHLLPLMPVALLAATVAARHGAIATRTVRPLAAAFGVTLALQMAVLAVASLSPLRHLVTAESREAYLQRSVSGYAPVAWINAHLAPTDRLLLSTRQLLYLLDPPTHLLHALDDGLFDFDPLTPDPRRYLASCRRLGITHVLAGLPADARADENDAAALLAAGCAVERMAVDTPAFGSRTLAAVASIRHRLAVLELVPCALDPS